MGKLSMKSIVKCVQTIFVLVVDVEALDEEHVHVYIFDKYHKFAQSLSHLFESLTVEQGFYPLPASPLS